jgi:hypothetical protein
MNLKNLFFNNNQIRPVWRISLFIFTLIILYTPIILILKLIPLNIIFEDKRLFLLISSFPLFVVVFAGSFLMTKFIEKKPFKIIGFAFHSNMKKEIIEGLIIGFILISIVFFVQLIFGIIKISWQGFPLYVLLINFIFYFILFSIQSSGEEAFFRGYLFQRLIEGTNKLIAILTISLNFGFIHIFNPNASLFACFNVFLSGIFFSIAYLKTRSLWLPSALHFSWNFFQGFFYSFPVSGVKINPRLFVLENNAHKILTGGDFGPEGSLIVSVVFLIAIIYISMSKRFSISNEMKEIL